MHKADIIWSAEGSDPALRITEQGLKISESLPWKHLSRVAILEKAGKILVNTSRFARGKQYYDKALLHIPDGEENNNIIANLYNSLSWYYLTQDDFEPAGMYARKALAIQESIFGKDARQLMGVYQSLSLIAHGAGNYDSAEYYGLSLLRIGEQHLNDAHPNLGLIHSGLGTIYETIKDYDRALYHFTETMRIMQNSYKVSGNPQMPALAFNNLAMVYKSIGEYTLAEYYYEKALELNKLSMGEESAGIIRPLTDLADVKRERKKYREADSLYNLGYTLQQKIDSQNDIQMAYVETQYGDLFYDKGDYAKAEGFYQKAIERYRKKGIQHTEIYLSTLNTLGAAKAKKGEISPAIQLHHDLVRKYREFHKPGSMRIAGQWNKIAEAYYQSANFHQAKQYSDSTFLELLMENKFPEGNWLMKLPFQINVLSYLKTRVMILQELYKREKNQDYLMQMIKLADDYSPYLEAGIPSLRTQASLIHLSEQHGYLYQAALEACWELASITDDQNYIRRSFEYSERSKGLILLLAANNILVDAVNASDASGSRDKFWRDKINRLNTEVLNAEGRNDSVLIALNAALESYKKFQDSLLKSGNPVFIQRYSLKPYGIEEIQHTLLKQNEILIEFEVTEERVYQYVISRNGFTAFAHPLTVLKDIPTLANLYRLSINEFQEPAFRLYNAFIKPVSDIYPNAKKLIVIPDREIYDLNFELLITDKEGTGFQTLPYLIRKFEITYQLSATRGIRLQSQPAIKPNKALLFAPVFTERMKENYKQRMGNSLLEDKDYYTMVSQPFSLQAAKEILRHIKGDLFVEEDAGEDTFREIARRYHILHLGTHAEANNHDPLHSRLVFARQDNDNGNDGYLYAYEIYGMDLPSNMAVLLACETGKGAFRNGEGVMSLAHSFMHAGSRSVVMSLWKIDEKTSSEIIVNFYEYLAEGYTKSEALRRAKIRYLDNNDGDLSHPYYWGGLAILGDTEAIKNKNTRVWLVVLGALIAGMILLKLKLKNS